MFASKSQAGQDRFAHALIGDYGTFLDIGCNHPIKISNSYALEELGWKGWLVDISPEFKDLIAETRRAPFILGDATVMDWSFLPPKVDYLSLDVDDATACVLSGLPVADRFRVVTVEHDAYRIGGGPRDVIRHTFNTAGYVLICADVKNEGFEYEDWWVEKSLEEAASKFKCQSKDWKEIFE